MKPNVNTPLIARLRRALEIASQIEALENEMNQVLAGNVGALGYTGAKRGRKPKLQAAPDNVVEMPVRRRRKRKMTPEGLANIRAAMQRRWSAFRKGKGAQPGKKVA